MTRFSYLIGLCALGLPLCASENILLKTGFHLAADRHEVDGTNIRLFTSGGVTEMPMNQVSSVEQIADPVPEAPAPKPELLVIVVETPKPIAPLTPADLARMAAQKYSLPAEFVASVMRAESNLNPAAISPKGAIGLMQLMPDTARQLGANPHKPDENADAGARYLRDLLAKYEDKPDQVALALAAYNAGPAAVEKYHGVPPYRETREYILRVLKAWNPPSAAK